MFLALALLLAFVWVMAFGVLNVTGVAIHTLIILAVASGILQLVHVRKYRAPVKTLPSDAIK